MNLNVFQIFGPQKKKCRKKLIIKMLYKHKFNLKTKYLVYFNSFVASLVIQTNTKKKLCTIYVIWLRNVCVANKSCIISTFNYKFPNIIHF